ncbi:MAG: sodium/proline symporter PutP [Acutalibacteraceae bacterium]
MTDTIWTLIAFAVYLAVMLIIGFIYFRKTKSSEDYILGGRSLNGWTAALSAQASDMSGWLLMGLPGAIYVAGTGEIWIAVGLLIGTVLNWFLVASRLRKYTIKAGNSLTLPSFFENRFRDRTRILKIVSSIFIAVFFLVYTASAFKAGAVLFNNVFNVDYTVALAIGALVILIYTFFGGFMAVCVTDFIQGLLMLAALMAVPIAAFAIMGGADSITAGLAANGVADVNGYLNPLLTSTGEPVTAVSIISNLGWALGYFGMPHILVRFMAIKSTDEVKKSRVIAIIWVIISLAAACFVGVIGKAFVGGALQDAQAENVFISMIIELFQNHWELPFIGGILLCGILAAVMSTADSQLLVTASSVSEDLYKGAINKKASEKSTLLISRITVAVVAVIAFIIALDQNSSVMGLVSNAWAGFGATFGPVILLSLFWKRSNLPGAVAGMICGGGLVMLWDYLPIIPGADGSLTLASATGLYSLVVGFALGLIAMIVVSLLTKKPAKEIVDEFEYVRTTKELDDLSGAKE